MIVFKFIIKLIYLKWKSKIKILNIIYKVYLSPQMSKAVKAELV